MGTGQKPSTEKKRTRRISFGGCSFFWFLIPPQYEMSARNDLQVRHEKSFPQVSPSPHKTTQQTPQNPIFFRRLFHLLRPLSAAPPEIPSEQIILRNSTSTSDSMAYCPARLTISAPSQAQLPRTGLMQRKIMERTDLEEAFESAESIDEMLEAFKAMETTFEEKDLGLACLKICLKLDKDADDPEKALSFTQRALRIFDDCNDSNTDHGSSNMFYLSIATTLQLLGSSSFNLKRDEQILPILHAVQLELFNVKTAMGRREEAIVHLKKSLEIKESTLDEDSKELGKANQHMAEVFVAVLNFKEALPFCLKALDIHKEHLGHNSVEVAYDKRLLRIIYTGLEDHEKTLEQNQLSRKVLKK
ncbi:Tetratricopeptide repeat (TPR)-like superfamily protein [Striga hermonthica]|uniref:Tetratricopeptide repeat (TPR)-like superfamily protein n=1 Tax=Striga hermonthica TaxID=68872 RepID=A0A9N7NNG3_STRHE|nr:Tetratricopeptide repeat (TPR)-like superfamily protein [Striga hermonthica]